MGAEAGGGQDQPGGLHRVAGQGLQPGCEQRGTRQQNHADGEHQRQAGAEIAVAEDGRRQERALGGQQVGDEQVDAETAEDGLDDDLAGAEPVLVLAAVEHELEGAEAEGEDAESEPIEAEFGLGFALGQK